MLALLVALIARLVINLFLQGDHALLEVLVHLQIRGHDSTVRTVLLCQKVQNYPVGPNSCIRTRRQAGSMQTRMI